MKLHRQPERVPRTRAVDVLAREQPPESEFFDPRVDFPASEWARIKKWAADIRQQPPPYSVETIQTSWWLGLVDPEFLELLKTNPQLANELGERYESFWKTSGDMRRASLEGVLYRSLPAIQIFPELRAGIRKDYGDHYLNILLTKKNTIPGLSMPIIDAAVLVQLYPEKRRQWMEVKELKEDDLVDRLSKEISNNQEDKAYVVANALLLFPDKRQELLSLISPNKEWEKGIKTETSPFSSRLMERLYHLTIIGADKAWIDEAGQIQLRLKPFPRPTIIHPLPDRSLA